MPHSALIESPERDVDVARDPWQREAVHVAADLGTNLSQGLSSEEAAARLARDVVRHPPGPGQGGCVSDGAELGTGRCEHRRVDGEREPSDDDR